MSSVPQCSEIPQRARSVCCRQTFSEENRKGTSAAFSWQRPIERKRPKPLVVMSRFDNTPKRLPVSRLTVTGYPARRLLGSKTVLSLARCQNPSATSANHHLPLLIRPSVDLMQPCPCGILGDRTRPLSRTWLARLYKFHPITSCQAAFDPMTLSIDVGIQSRACIMSTEGSCVASLTS